MRRALAEKLYQWDSQLEAILLGYERAKLRAQQEQGAADGPRNIITLKEKFNVHHYFSDRHLFIRLVRQVRTVGTRHLRRDRVKPLVTNWHPFFMATGSIIQESKINADQEPNNA